MWTGRVMPNLRLSRGVRESPSSPGAGRRDRTDQEGPEPKRIVILEFADTAAFKRWYNSPEYQKILPARLDNSTARAFVVEGVS